MFPFTMWHLLFSSLILLKVIKAVTKGIYSAILKVCSYIENDLNRHETSQFSKTIHARSEKDSFNNLCLNSKQTESLGIVDENHSSTVKFSICNLPTENKIIVRDLNTHKVVMDSSKIPCQRPINIQQGLVTNPGTSQSVCLQSDVYLNKDLPQTPSKSSLLNHDYSISQSRQMHHQASGAKSFSEGLGDFQKAEQSPSTKIFVWASDRSSVMRMITFDQNMQSEMNGMLEYDPSNVPVKCFKQSRKLQSFSTKDDFLCKRSQDTTTPNESKEYSVENRSSEKYFEDQESNSEISTKTKHRDDVEANLEEVKLDPKEDERLAENDVIEENSNSFEKNRKFQSNEVCSETSRENDIEGSKGETAFLKKCSAECSESQIKDEVLSDEIFNDNEIKVGEEPQKVLENVKPGEKYALLPSNTLCNPNTSPTTTSGPLMMVKNDNKEISDLLMEVNPIILRIEDLIVTWCRRILNGNSRLMKKSKDLKLIDSLLDKLLRKSDSMDNEDNRTRVILYTNAAFVRISKIKQQMTVDYTTYSLKKNRRKIESYLDDIRRQVVEKRQLLSVNVTSMLASKIYKTSSV